MNTTQPEALRVSGLLRVTGHKAVSANMISDAILVIESQHARITELESQLAQRFDAAAMLAAAPAQQGVAYAALPEKYYLAGGEVPTWDAKQMHAFADATHAIRASRGQAPALWLSPEQFANFVDADEAPFGKYVPARKTSVGKFTMPLFAAPAQPAAEPANADRVQEDAALWHWLAEYLVGTRTDLDDEIVASETVNDLRKLVKAALKQGENHDR